VSFQCGAVAKSVPPAPVQTSVRGVTAGPRRGGVAHGAGRR
jgi:hypothetical protein